ncbi:MAG: hypothetical protein ABI905_11225, partial [Betaproteobacteria bacterium]
MAETSAPPASPPPVGSLGKNSRAKIIAGVIVLFLVAAIALGEAMEWPFLAKPLQKFLTSALDRKVTLAPGSNATDQANFGVRFIGGIRLHSGYFNIAAPEWSKAPHFLTAENVALKLHYADLWHARNGKHLRIDSLTADTLDGNLERLADGRASWQFGKKSTATPPVEEAADISAAPLFGNLEVAKGELR